MHAICLVLGCKITTAPIGKRIQTSVLMTGSARLAQLTPGTSRRSTSAREPGPDLAGSCACLRTSSRGSVPRLRLQAPAPQSSMSLLSCKMAVLSGVWPGLAALCLPARFACVSCHDRPTDRRLLYTQEAPLLMLLCAGAACLHAHHGLTAEDPASNKEDALHQQQQCSQPIHDPLLSPQTMLPGTAPLRCSPTQWSNRNSCLRLPAPHGSRQACLLILRLQTSALPETAFQALPGYRRSGGPPHSDSSKQARAASHRAVSTWGENDHICSSLAPAGPAWKTLSLQFCTQGGAAAWRKHPQGRLDSTLKCAQRGVVQHLAAPGHGGVHLQHPRGRLGVQRAGVVLAHGRMHPRPVGCQRVPAVHPLDLRPDFHVQESGNSIRASSKAALLRRLRASRAEIFVFYSFYVWMETRILHNSSLHCLMPEVHVEVNVHGTTAVLMHLQVCMRSCPATMRLHGPRCVAASELNPLNTSTPLL